MSPTDTATLAAPDPVLLRELEGDRLAAADDGSHYRLTPQAVGTARDADDVAATMRAARRSGVPITFRSGGTSLLGRQERAESSSTRARISARRGVLEGADLVRTGPGASRIEGLV